MIRCDLFDSVKPYRKTPSLSDLDFFCKGVEWIYILFFHCTEPLGNALQVSKYLGEYEAEMEIYSGQVYRNELL